MIINKKRVVSLFIALALVLSFSLQTIATAESPVLAQELIEESTENEIPPDLLIVPTDESLKADEEQPQPEPELKPDPKPDEVTLGASGQEEKPAAGPIERGTRAGTAVTFGQFTITPDASTHYKESYNNTIYPVFDYLKDFEIAYHGNRLTSGWTYMDDANNISNDLGTPNTGTKVNGNIFVYYFDLILNDTYEYGTFLTFISTAPWPQGDTTQFYLTIDAVSGKFLAADGVTLITDYGINPVPSSIKATFKYEDAANTDTSTITKKWVVTGTGITTPLEFATETEFQDYIKYDGNNKLPEGTYNVELQVGGKTVNGGIIPEDFVTNGATTFTVKYPIPTVAIDKAVNPTSIVVARDTAYSPNSTYTWQVYKWDGTIETPLTGFSGTGASTDISTTLDLPTIKDLAAGSYRVRIVETDATNSVIKGEAFGDFTIVDPLVIPALVGGFTTSPASPALPANPTSGTGTPKFADSTVTWEILDKDGNALGTPVNGSTTVELEAAYKTLPEGEYKLQYTETATYNGRTHSDSVPFQIINPLTSSAVDKPTNPTSGTGTQKMPAGESVVTWEILDSNNQVVGSGTGLTVPKAEFDKLPNGDYKLKFTETSGYNQAVHSHEVPFKMDVAIPVAKGTLEVKHVFLDENGNVVTTPATITNNYTENVGTAYTTTSLTSTAIPTGYRLVTSKLPTNATGTYKTTSTVVEYYYEPIPKVQPGQGTVTTVHTIQHTDGSVTAYATEDPIIDKIGKHYATTPIAIPGYILKEVPSNDDGTIATGNQTVTYVYIPDPTQAQLTEQHLIVDGAGNVIGVIDVVATARPDGTPYTTTAKAPAGYKLVTNRAPANATGTYKTGTERVVSYYYAKIADPVTPNPGTGGGSWTPNGWTNRPSTNPNADKSPNTTAIMVKGFSDATTDDNSEAALTSGDNTEPTEDSDVDNPQTGDSTNQENMLNILYIVLIGAFAVFVLNVLLPRKKQKR